MPDKKISLYVVIKVAEVCNIACTYCYFFFGGDESYKEKPGFMPHATMVKTANFLRKGVEDLGITDLTVCFHGGEPLMVGKRRFGAYCRALREALDDIVRLRIDVQTNAMLVDDAWIQLFSEHDVGIGVSIDGPAAMHDRVRIDKNYVGTHSRTVEGLAKLQQAVANGQIRAPAAICVLGEDSDAATLFDYFFDELKVRAVSFRAPIMDWGTLSPEVEARTRVFYRELLDLWLSRGDPGLTIELFRRLFGGLLADHNWFPATHELPLIVVRSDGALCPHDALGPLDLQYQNSGCSIFTHSLQSFFDHNLWGTMAWGFHLPEQECSSCKWAGACGGGDVENRFDPVAGFKRKSVYCETYRDVCDRLHLYAARSMSTVEIDRRLSRRRATLLSLRQKEVDRSAVIPVLGELT
ncbi:radical SAM protein [Sphingomonas pokkalii]|nr:radical SAM protein [Sphingomonas pokkalii]